MVDKINPSSKRATISDVAKKANVGVATVDRVINQRATVSAKTTKKVLQAAKELNFRTTHLMNNALINNARTCVVGVILQGKESHYLHSLTEEMKKVCELYQEHCRLEFCILDDISCTSMCEAITHMAKYCHLLGILTADHPQINETIKKTTEAGVPVITLISEISSQYVTTHIGEDARSSGRTAGWYIANLAKNSGSVGLIISDHRFLCQETYEVGFRTYIREKRQDLKIVDAVISQKDPNLAQQSTEQLLTHYPDLVGLYHAGGNPEGVVNALKQHNQYQMLTVISNELTGTTSEALRDGYLDIILSCRKPELSHQFIKSAIKIYNNKEKYIPIRCDVSSEILCSENI
ncbi:LacI family DNA-binding transcriptional regulator [Vibrio salinus]|uniref:LacI family DNA-binding transcriptional regulator n=1 Tax=Vibrio salinus TaxID=2899784 RepID=UPI001E598E8F|nr:LacI family DNA-binding transcriptional regulator [Vibrio salinus]MCE0495315.1 LacI family DNA-binding transcriptional regulator [Vibrio salinus]